MLLPKPLHQQLVHNTCCIAHAIVRESGISVSEQWQCAMLINFRLERLMRQWNNPFPVATRSNHCQ